MLVGYGPWRRVYDLFRRWQGNGTWQRILTLLQSLWDARAAGSRPSCTWLSSMVRSPCPSSRPGSAAIRRLSTRAGEGSRASQKSQLRAGLFLDGTDCYHRGMAKTQKGWRVDDEIAELATARARDRGMAVGDYIAALVREDVGGLRQRGLDAAQRFLDEHQAAFDEAEDADRHMPGAHAA